ncbi:hypothetical protein RU639_002966 [Aspergillus parasiticus]
MRPASDHANLAAYLVAGVYSIKVVVGAFLPSWYWNWRFCSAIHPRGSFTLTEERVQLPTTSSQEALGSNPINGTKPSNIKQTHKTQVHRSQACYSAA